MIEPSAKYVTEVRDAIRERDDRISGALNVYDQAADGDAAAALRLLIDSEAADQAYVERRARIRQKLTDGRFER